MEDKFYFPHEIREIVQQVIFDEIRTIIYDWEGTQAEEKIAAIDGMYILEEAINRYFAKSGEEKEEEE